MSVSTNATIIPATTGALDYNGDIRPGLGGSYVDSKFSTTVYQITAIGNTLAIDNLYGHCMANADGTRYYGRIQGQSNACWVNSSSGAILNTGLTQGPFAGADDQCHPTSSDTYIYYVASSAARGIHQKAIGGADTQRDLGFNLHAGGGESPLGGTQNICDRTGRYFLYRRASNNQVGVYDWQTDTVYSNTVPMANYAAMTPDGSYIHSGDDNHIAYAINHAASSVATTGILFWPVSASGGADHACSVVGTDNVNYAIVLYAGDSSGAGTANGIYRATMSTNRAGLTGPQVLASGGVTKLMPGFSDFLEPFTWNFHMTTPSAGATSRNWCIFSTEANNGAGEGGDSLNAVPNVDNDWCPGKQEIIAVDFINNVYKRLAHHRSRSLATQDYNCQPRPSCSWDGSVALFASNFNQAPNSGYSDIYAILNPLGQEDPATTASFIWAGTSSLR